MEGFTCIHSCNECYLLPRLLPWWGAVHSLQQSGGWQPHQQRTGGWSHHGTCLKKMLLGQPKNEPSPVADHFGLIVHHSKYGSCKLMTYNITYIYIYVTYMYIYICITHTHIYVCVWPGVNLRTHEPVWRTSPLLKVRGVFQKWKIFWWHTIWYVFFHAPSIAQTVSEPEDVNGLLWPVCLNHRRTGLSELQVFHVTPRVYLQTSSKKCSHPTFVGQNLQNNGFQWFSDVSVEIFSTKLLLPLNIIIISENMSSTFIT